MSAAGYQTDITPLRTGTEATISMPKPPKKERTGTKTAISMPKPPEKHKTGTKTHYFVPKMRITTTVNQQEAHTPTCSGALIL